MLHGFLNIDKPAGLTSHDIVASLRRLAGQKRIGHGGTLDPAATGVLPVALGEATRLLDYLVEGRKRYAAAIVLGVVTTTDDAEGEVVKQQPVPVLHEADIAAVLRTFTGAIRQVPPMYSAIQVGGRRLYDLARQGVQLELAPRQVEIDAIQLLAWQPPLLAVDVVCGKGTYIRALARDLGEQLGCGGHLQSLRRTAVGSLCLDTAVSLDALLDAPASLAAHLLPPDVAIAHLPRIDLDEVAAERIRHGLAIETSSPAVDVVRAHAPDGRLLALLRYDNGVWRPSKVFAWR
jgi:tRNA pseudouridine55 synthase